MYYTQGSEEKFIINYLLSQPTGRFIDIGSYDVFRFSNVRRLFEIGWGGVMVEPSTPNFKSIAEHYAEVERIEVLNIALGDETKEIDFYESNGDAVSTTDKEHMAKWGAAGVEYSKVKVQQVSVTEFMKQYCTPDVAFVSLDTECMNLLVFRLIPDWVLAQIKMIVVEHDLAQEEMSARLNLFGFSVVHTNAENIVACKL